ncbi:hypothetical protein PHYPSEUDO_012802 [Phytophthora pseudosyringae]|uniref:Uncharacterized protein n=1 Tax=Phytophthora pseudosyringae TaxID=221518 RepID=A0A8T1VB19_9STRA|nr:hypothetical protein PHYPSEUDO_012802 [Phytophthora pseudosyringae]
MSNVTCQPPPALNSGAGKALDSINASFPKRSESCLRARGLAASVDSRQRRWRTTAVVTTNERLNARAPRDNRTSRNSERGTPFRRRGRQHCNSSRKRSEPRTFPNLLEPLVRPLACIRDRRKRGGACTPIDMASGANGVLAIWRGVQYDRGGRPVLKLSVDAVYGGRASLLVSSFNVSNPAHCDRDSQGAGPAPLVL